MTQEGLDEGAFFEFEAVEGDHAGDGAGGVGLAVGGEGRGIGGLPAGEDRGPVDGETLEEAPSLVGLAEAEEGQGGGDAVGEHVGVLAEEMGSGVVGGVDVFLEEEIEVGEVIARGGVLGVSGSHFAHDFAEAMGIAVRFGQADEGEEGGAGGAGFLGESAVGLHGFFGVAGAFGVLGDVGEGLGFFGGFEVDASPMGLSLDGIAEFLGDAGAVEFAHPGFEGEGVMVEFIADGVPLVEAGEGVEADEEQVFAGGRGVGGDEADGIGEARLAVEPAAEGGLFLAGDGLVAGDHFVDEVVAGGGVEADAHFEGEQLVVALGEGVAVEAEDEFLGVGAGDGGLGGEEDEGFEGGLGGALGKRPESFEGLLALFGGRGAEEEAGEGDLDGGVLGAEGGGAADVVEGGLFLVPGEVEFGGEAEVGEFVGLFPEEALDFGFGEFGACEVEGEFGVFAAVVGLGGGEGEEGLPEEEGLLLAEAGIEAGDDADGGGFCGGEVVGGLGFAEGIFPLFLAEVLLGLVGDGAGAPGFGGAVGGAGGEGEEEEAGAED